MNNIRGLRIGTNSNWRRPSSDHALFHYLKSHVLCSDVTVLVETKTVGQFYEENDPHIPNVPVFNNFKPFGNNFPSVLYSCDGPSNGIIIFINDQTVEILNSEVIEVGRLVKIIGQKRATKENFTLFAGYFTAGNDLDSRVEYCNLINRLSTNLSSATAAGNTVYIVGDLNADVYCPARINRVKEKALRDLINEHKLIDLRMKADNTEPTFFPSDVLKKSATLDYILHNKPTRYRSVINSVNPCSDHSIVRISNDTKPSPPGDTIFNKLFENTKFIQHVTPILTEFHNEFCRTHGDDLDNPDNPAYLNWLSTIIDKLSFENKKFQTQNIRSLRKTNNKVNRSMAQLFKRLMKKETPQGRAELENLKAQHLAQLSEELKLSTNSFRVKQNVHAATSHRSCYTAFQTKGTRHISMIECPNTGRMLSNALEIAEAFASYQQNKVKKYDPHPEMTKLGIAKSSPSSLQSVLDKHNISMSQIFPSLPPSPSTSVSPAEILSAIKSFKNHSSPGPSGQGKKFFQFLFKFNNEFFSRSINQLLKVQDFENSEFSWLKNRSIIFIKKKPNKKSIKCSDFRPISLLETLYKILSKLLLGKVVPFMNDIVGPHQFGFAKGRAMSLCSISTIAAIEYMKQEHPEGAAILFDIQSAFDSITNDAILTTLEYIFPNSPLPQMIFNLSAGGYARVFVNKFFSCKFGIHNGSGQGDNLSGIKYNLVHHVFKSLLQLLIDRKLPQIRIPLPTPPGLPPSVVPMFAYADDTNAFLKISNTIETEKIKEIFIHLKIATGLSINPEKTLIITPQPSSISAESKIALNSIGKVVDSAEHLGLVIGKNHEESYSLSWQNALAKLKKKIKLIGWKISYSDMFARKMLISALLQSTLNHVIRVFPPSQELIKEVDSLLLKTLWEKMFHGEKYGRPTIAKNRLHLPISKGGLDWNLFSSRSVTCFFSSLFHTIKYTLSNTNSFLAEFCPINRDNLFRQSSSSNLVELKMTAKKLFWLPPHIFLFYFDSFAQRLSQLEKHPDFFQFGSIQYAPLNADGTQNIRHSLFRLSNDEMKHFPPHASIATILARPPPLPSSDTPSPLPLPLSPYTIQLNSLQRDTLPVNITNKLRRTVDDLNAICNNTKQSKIIRNLSRYSPENSFNFLYRAVFLNNSFLTIPYYKMEQAFPSNIPTHVSNIPPSYNTRLRDGAALPSSIETFLSAYQFVQSASLPSRSKSFILDILNRTTPSKRTLFRSKLVSNEICELCNVVSDNFHTVAECMYSFMIVTSLSKYLASKGIVLTEDTYAFFAPIKNVSYNFNSQIIHILCEVARRAFSTINNERWANWTGTPFFAQIRSILLSIIRTRKYAGWAYKEVLNFEEYFSSYIDNIHDLTPSNISHFRASPTYVPSADSFNDQDHFDEFLQRSQTNPRIISV